MLSDSEVQAYIGGTKFLAGKLSVETAMCVNFNGWGKFSNSALRIHSNVCFPHGSGILHYFLLLFSIPDGGHSRYCGRDNICMSSTFRTERRTMIIMILQSTSVRFSLRLLLLGFKNCSWIIFAPPTVKQLPIGVVTSGRASMADVSRA